MRPGDPGPLMTFAVAPTSLAIRVITGIVLVANAGLFAAAACGYPLWPAALILLLLVAACWVFWAPVAYETDGRTLVVRFRVGRVRYGPVTRAAAVAERLSGVIRLFGNGGLFAGCGIFWSRAHGLFRAYVTRSAPRDLVLVEAGGRKVFVSPADPAALRTALSPPPR